MIEINKDVVTLSIVQSYNIRDVLKLFLCVGKNWGARFSRIVRKVLWSSMRRGFISLLRMSWTFG